ncbi:TrmB family transcriptional regulator sugar-binding domain-containing protein [Pyrococcus abyssi]|uniref:Transcription regulator TrmB C-terminal domain-containing protein n=1 Tax=Pyrococcus abyssi (strain GE5 / Orsay) TaxID=272844 RepID=Q9V2I1_PYRAB|nr:TrmB family transcriptional regulator sugar-binding domain-containing protein [Pyrococcus abyssi]CAB49017.1 Hypothetical protein PAB0053 [Pyrococcus abyssi GE5]CCE69469.1 TPA: hypothetical protein PAB0053 [Pyrococcus abyssi GE5]
MDKYRLVVILIILVGISGVIITKVSKHYQGGEIYEAANEAMNLLAEGFNVTIKVTSVDGRTITGELFAAKGSEIIIIVNGTKITVGGPSATKEDIKAKHIEVIHKGKVYVYEVPGTKGDGWKTFSWYEKYRTQDTYSMRFSGLIYIENISIIELGELKYSADYLTFGSVTIKGIYGNNAIIWANYVPIEILREYLKGKEVFYYGTLYVNSEKRNLPLKVLEVRSG